MDHCKIFAEIKRVLRSGGRAVIVDGDWATLSVDFCNTALERKLINYFSQHVRSNGIAGRTLKKRLIDSGFKDVTVKTRIAQFESFDQMPWIGSALVNQAVADEIITSEEGDCWINELIDSSKKGTFFATTVTSVAIAIKGINKSTTFSTVKVAYKIRWVRKDLF